MRTLYFLWLFFTPLLIGTGIFLVSSLCLDDQKSLLLQLKGSLQFNSTLSTKLAHWNQTSDCCYWGGVTCDAFGHVISLELDSETISGGIENSSSLFSFQYLERLNLADNSFNGEIPVGICNLTKLKYLNLSDVGFVGQIPFTLSRLQRLVTLDLSVSFNYRKPTLKLENPNLRNFIENATELRELYLDGVDLSAQRNEWCQSLSSHLPNLTVLSLRDCQISGPIHESLSKIPSLSVIRLDWNYDLSSTVPEFFANFSNLTTLSLSFCNLHGSFPEKIFQLHALEYLDLSYNYMLSGSIPNFPPNGSLKVVSLRETNFSGSLPESISNLQKLSMLDLPMCKFSGTIPSTMENLTELVYVDFSLNNFTGSIPYFQPSKKLWYLDLSSNALTGYLSPSHFEGLSELSYMNLGNNVLNGILPAYIFELPSLGKLLLYNNQFAGQVKEFRNASSSLLEEIDLRNNRLSGTIPKSIFEVEGLNILKLSSNFFCGTVSLELIGQRLRNMEELDLSYNNLTVEIGSNATSLSFPQLHTLKLASCRLKRFPDLKNQLGMWELDLSYNNLTVDISSNATSLSLPQLFTLKLASCRLKKFPDLKNQLDMTELDLSDNQISGPVPNWVWGIGYRALQHLNLSCNQLEYLEHPYNVLNIPTILDLHSNRIKGDLQPFFLAYVNYSNNKFSNSIAPDIVIPFPIFISVANNSLTGRIPESICNATQRLQLVDFSNNALSGTIPPCLLGNNTVLGVLNLGKNKLGGVIPDSFPIGCALQTLDLTENKLQGTLPKSLLNCNVLEVLNVGHNKLVDSFPSMLKNTSSLRVLVLRSNQFYGDFKCYSWKNLQIIDIASNKFTGELSAECLSNWRGMMVGDDYTESGHNLIQFSMNATRYYEDKVTITSKGKDMKLVKILRVYTCIDFSSNRFQGVIPEMLESLSALYALNLSHNALEGPIPKSLGKLRTLESLDLSRNRLSGEIPVELAGLTFLSHLNLSFNKLFGRIPIGTQFSTFSPAFFEGNEGLCGLPLKECKTNASELILPTPTPDSPEDSGFDWTIIFVGAGYVAGAANTIALLWYYEPVKIWFDILVAKFLIWLSNLFVRLTT